MIYDAPELRLVGATRQIVLGTRLNKSDGTDVYKKDNDDIQYEVEVFEEEW